MNSPNLTREEVEAIVATRSSYQFVLESPPAERARRWASMEEGCRDFEPLSHAPDSVLAFHALLIFLLRGLAEDFDKKDVEIKRLQGIIRNVTWDDSKS